MAEPVRVQAISASVAVVKPGQTVHPQPTLCMTWRVDPVSGELVARWAAKRADAAASVRLRVAA